MIGFVVTFHYPLNHHPARLAAEHLEGFWFGWTSISRAFSIAQSCLFVAASLAVAMVVRSPAGQAAAGGASPGAPAAMPVFRCSAGLLSLCNIKIRAHTTSHVNFSFQVIYLFIFARKTLSACMFSPDGACKDRKNPRPCFLCSAWTTAALAVSSLCS